MKWEEKRGEKEGTGRERAVQGFQTALKKKARRGIRSDGLRLKTRDQKKRMESQM